MRTIGSMRARMTLAFSVGIALLMALAVGGLVWQARLSAEHTASAILQETARKVQQELAEGDRNPNLSELVEDTGNALIESPTLLLVDGDGRVLQKTGSPSPPWPHRPGDGWRVATVPWGSRAIVIGLPWARTERTLRNQATLLVLLSLAILGFATLGARAVVAHTLSPIDGLCQQVRAASGDDLHVQLTSPSRDAEMVGLVETLNGLLERQRETAAARTRFYAAASHELRTPLQALSGHLELALARPRSNDEYVRSLREAHAQTQRLVSLVRALLLLNRLDTAPPPPQEPTNVEAVLRATLELFAPLMQERGLRLQTAIEPGIHVMAAPAHLEMLIRNLVENAAKYTPNGGAVSIHLKAEAEVVRLLISNECSLPASDEPWPTEPFYRPDASRSAATGGNGLGLAVCQAVARANGWRLTLRRRNDLVEADVAFGRQVVNGGDGVC